MLHVDERPFGKQHGEHEGEKKWTGSQVPEHMGGNESKAQR